MKLVWSPETASKSYIDTVKLCKVSEDSGEAELISAMAGGWNSNLILEAWCYGSTITTSKGLAIAANHSGGRHLCILKDQRSRLAYLDAMKNFTLPLPEILLEHEAGQVPAGVDFMVVDGRNKEFSKIVHDAKLSQRGAVLLCRNARERVVDGFRWSAVLGSTTRVVRSLVLPVGNGVDIAYVATSNGGATKNPNRWIRRIDHRSGEEHVFRG